MPICTFTQVLDLCTLPTTDYIYILVYVFKRGHFRLQFRFSAKCILNFRFRPRIFISVHHYKTAYPTFMLLYGMMKPPGTVLA